MQRREQYLIGGLLGAAAIWMMSGWVSSAVFGPFQVASDKLEDLKKRVSNKNDSMRALAVATKSLKEWKAGSLPPDPGKPKQPSALNAQRQYMEWLTDLAELSGFEDRKVIAGSTTTKGKVYIAVAVKLDAEARFEQLTNFLDLFYRTELMHRITSMRVTTKVFEGDPLLKISLEAEGLALLDTPPRRTIFPETILTAELADTGKTLQVANSKDFPTETGFRIRIRNEFLKVTAIDGDVWTVERGIERTSPAAYSDATPVEQVRLRSNQERTLTELREMVSNNIFVKPSPKYKMKFGPLSEKAFTRGKPIDFNISVLGYDSLLGKPEFAIVGDAPAGLKLEKSGKITWRPGPDVALGKYPVQFEVRHPSAPEGSLKETVTIRIRDPLAAYKFADTKPIRVYLNREWIYRPEIIAAEASTAAKTKVTWKLGDRSPKGMKINDKTGELKWTPGDEVAVGEMTVPLIITDSDSPPQSTNLPLKIQVEDDAAQFTRLTMIFAEGAKKRAFLFDPSTDKKTELHEGDGFAIADLSGTIKSIAGKHVIMSMGEREIRWDIGQSLREAQQKIKEY